LIIVLKLFNPEVRRDSARVGPHRGGGGESIKEGWYEIPHHPIKVIYVIKDENLQ
jgi:hypothetical protein